MRRFSEDLLGDASGVLPTLFTVLVLRPGPCVQKPCLRASSCPSLCWASWKQQKDPRMNAQAGLGDQGKGGAAHKPGSGA